MSRFKPGECGNPDGRPKADREKFKFDFLDSTAIPAAIKHLYQVVIGEQEDIKGMKGQEKVRLQNEAAKALLAKAPDRMQGNGANGEFLHSLVIFTPKKDE